LLEHGHQCSHAGRVIWRDQTVTLGVDCLHVFELLVAEVEFDEFVSAVLRERLREQLHAFGFSLGVLDDHDLVGLAGLDLLVLHGVRNLLLLLVVGFGDLLLVILFSLRNDDGLDFLALGDRLLGQVDSDGQNFGQLESHEFCTPVVFFKELVQTCFDVLGHRRTVAKDFAKGHAAERRA